MQAEIPCVRSPVSMPDLLLKSPSNFSLLFKPVFPKVSSHQPPLGEIRCSESKGQERTVDSHKSWSMGLLTDLLSPPKPFFSSVFPTLLSVFISLPTLYALCHFDDCQYQRDFCDPFTDVSNPDLSLKLYIHLANSWSHRLLKIHRSKVETITSLLSSYLCTSGNGLTTTHLSYLQTWISL